MKTLNLKAIPICYKNNAYHLSKKEFNIIKNIKFINTYGNDTSIKEEKSEKRFYISMTKTLLQNKGLINLRKFLVQQAEDYTKNVLQIKNEIYLTQSWSTFSGPKTFHPPHFHPNTFISVIYYAQCEKGVLMFDVGSSSLQECFNLDYSIDKFNIYNSQEWNLVIQTGDVVLFPGHIRHSSHPNLSSTPKIIVGANFFIKGTLGSYENTSLLKI